MNKGFSNSVLTTSQPSSRAQGSISPLKQQGEVCNEIIPLATDGLTVDALLAQLMGEDGPNFEGENNLLPTLDGSLNDANQAVSSDGMICKDFILAKLQVGVSWCAIIPSYSLSLPSVCCFTPCLSISMFSRPVT